jgi:hypothetical protein
MLMVSRIARTADGINYGGMRNNNQVLRWEKSDDQIFCVVFLSVTPPVILFRFLKRSRNSNFEPDSGFIRYQSD